MGKNGGRRPGAGRKKGRPVVIARAVAAKSTPYTRMFPETRVKGSGVTALEVRDANALLKDSAVLLLNRALYLATKKDPNTVVLTKLLDKILPTLTDSRVKGAFITMPFSDLPEDQLKQLASEYAKMAEDGK